VTVLARNRTGNCVTGNIIERDTDGGLQFFFFSVLFINVNEVVGLFNKIALLYSKYCGFR
jgi:hypothetical protein